MSKISYTPSAQERHEALAQMERWRRMAVATPVGVQVWRAFVWGSCAAILIAACVGWW